MIFERHIPKFPLNQFIECFIYYEAPMTIQNTIDRFLPDGNVEILIDMNDAPQYIYDNTTLKEIQACQHVWASGVRTEAISIPSGRGASMMVIAFKHGMAYPFFPVPMNEISDCVVDADLLWGPDFGILRERILEKRHSPSKFQIVEDFLIKKFHSKMILNPCVEYAIGAIVDQPDQIKLGNLNQKIGYSQKHFIDLFKRHVGIAPKAYLKIMRFQKAVNEIGRQKEVDWTGVSLDCGFYDQSHFINDFKLFSGFTPEQYANYEFDYLNYVPVA